jgi:adenylate kinase
MCAQHLSTGDLLRREIEAASELGLAVERIVSGGRLVPAALVIGIVEANLQGEGFVLDGYPRTEAQALGLFRRELLVPDLAIEIDVPEAVARERLSARGRADDAPDVLTTRMQAFDRETKPAIAVLEREGILHRVDGDDDAQCVHRRVWDVVVENLQTSRTTVRR